MIPTSFPGYQVVEKIARGGFSEVYKVTPVGVEAVFALKALNDRGMRDPSGRAALSNEFQVISRLSHDLIVRPRELNADAARPFMVMDFFEHVPFRRLIGEPTARLADNLMVCAEVARALVYVHEQGYIHKDVKPDNVLVGADSIRLVDFAFAERPRRWFSRAPRLEGTPEYLAPEVLLKKRPDRAADVYSFGVMLFEAAAGRLPFLGTTPEETARAQLADPLPFIRHYRREAPPALQTLVESLCRKKPRDRPCDLREARAQIMKCRRDIPT
ncbi:MAG: serine/threonine protein kinase [Planctomycetes bacterium]|nr:serine/threonine protein kinase [Planctomycetota bacterium]